MSDQRARFEEWATLRKMDISFFIPPTGHSSFYGNEETQTAWEAWQAACPEGWQAVPKEPTQKMLHTYKESSIAPIGPISIHGYRKMLSAAPTPGDV